MYVAMLVLLSRPTTYTDEATSGEPQAHHLTPSLRRTQEVERNHSDPHPLRPIFGFLLNPNESGWVAGGRGAGVGAVHSPFWARSMARM